MTKSAGSLKTALHAALDAAAPDQESWLKGEETFWNALQELGLPDGRALSKALDAAAPNGDSWRAGSKAFWAARKHRLIANASKTAGTRIVNASKAVGRELAGKPATS